MNTTPNKTEAKLPPRILILDDEEVLTEMLAQTFQMLGCESTQCNNAKDALELIQKQEFDILLSDYKMPDMNGREFYGQVRALSPAIAGRIIFMTGDAYNTDTLNFLKETGNNYISKPFQLSEVASTVMKMLGKSG